MIINCSRTVFGALLLWLTDICQGHSIVTFVVPSLADPRENSTLSCGYDMGKDRLFSTKWYRNHIEIFRYMPTQKPSGLSFPVEGIYLAKSPQCSQISCDLELTNVTSASAGQFMCEVSTEGPMFNIKKKSANMTVIALLRGDPLVEGASTTYTLGEEIRINCTSDPSLPPSEVTWNINDNEATYPLVRSTVISKPDSRGLTTTSLSLRLIADRSLFIGSSNPELKLMCVSKMPPSVPGGPHGREFTMTVALRLPTLFNQRLAWLESSSAETSSGRLALLTATAAALMLLKAALQRQWYDYY